MDISTLFVAALLLWGAASAARFTFHRRRDAALLAAPPDRAYLEVSLPAGGTVASAGAMTRFWAAVVRSASGRRRSGHNQIDLLHVVTRPDADAQPTMRTYIVCDRAALRNVRREIAQQLAGSATIVTVPDPLALPSAGVVRAVARS